MFKNVEIPELCNFNTRNISIFDKYLFTDIYTCAADTVVSVLYDTNYIPCDACARQSMDSDAKHGFLACLKQGLS